MPRPASPCAALFSLALAPWRLAPTAHTPQCFSSRSQGVTQRAPTSIRQLGTRPSQAADGAVGRLGCHAGHSLSLLQPAEAAGRRAAAVVGTSPEGRGLAGSLPPGFAWCSQTGASHTHVRVLPQAAGTRGLGCSAPALPNAHRPVSALLIHVVSSPAPPRPSPPLLHGWRHLDRRARGLLPRRPGRRAARNARARRAGGLLQARGQHAAADVDTPRQGAAVEGVGQRRVARRRLRVCQQRPRLPALIWKRPVGS